MPQFTRNMIADNHSVVKLTPNGLQGHGRDELCELVWVFVLWSFPQTEHLQWLFLQPHTVLWGSMPYWLPEVKSCQKTQI